MMRFLVSYAFLEALVVVAAVVGTLWARKRRLRAGRRVSLEGFVPTDERFIDPTTGIRQRVWFNPVTGERRYQTIDRDGDDT
ncbi:MAG TPA: hypothetical protein VKB31_04375 [Trueperaceae bacterium]|nr:hypothetical protein [Trueperaceae bacterium]